MACLRVIADGAWIGSMNMARDEALLYGVSEKGAPPALRFYSWSRPTLSLGRNQKISGINLDALAKNGIDLVRRPTGGSSVLHEFEITYSATFGIPKGSGSGIVASCRMIHESILEALKAMGIETEMAPQAPSCRKSPDEPVCFASPSDTELTTSGGTKVIGSAQMRRLGYLMQHGSIPYRMDPERLLSLFNETGCSERSITRGIPVEGLEDRFAGLFAERLSKRLGLEAIQESLSECEEEEAERLNLEKYSAREWTERR